MDGSTSYGAEFFARLDEGSTAAARAVAPLVFDLLHPRSVVDVGCGTGSWLEAFEDLGVDDLLGVDGKYNLVAPARLGADRFVGADLATGCSVQRTFDLVISIEVAEHLRPDRAAGFVHDLAELGQSVLFSAAVPGQGGTGHVNEQWPSYWASLFRAEGFSVHDPIRPELWDRVAVPIAVRQNLLLYCRAGQPSPVQAQYLDIAHPQWVDACRAAAERPGLRAMARALPGSLARAVRRIG